MVLIGSRTVRPWFWIALVTACRIHHVAYVLNLNPRCQLLAA